MRFVGELYKVELLKEKHVHVVRGRSCCRIDGYDAGVRVVALVVRRVSGSCFMT